MPAIQIPSFRIQKAVNDGAAHKWLFYCWGGLGDRVCAEPTIRWAYKHLRWEKFAVATEAPELFSHIGCDVYKIGDPALKQDDWYTTWTIQPPGNLVWEFFSHCMVQAVDYVSLSCLRMQLPVADRAIELPNSPTMALPYSMRNAVIVHPGKHWQSKTFPGSWWKAVCRAMIMQGVTPLIVGRHVDQNVGYVDFEAPAGCLDMRDQMTLGELVGTVKQAPCVISNDSAVIHIAAAGNSFIGVVATCKHPDYLGHWRHGRWAWRFENLSRGGLYQSYQVSPFRDDGKDATVEFMEPDLLLKCLPDPNDVARFARESVDRYYD